MKKIRFLLLAAAFLAASLRSEAQDFIYTPEDTVAYHRAMERLLHYAGLSSGDLMVKAAMLFEGTPYVAGTLEVVPEVPVIGLCRTDCILFVEMCVALVELVRESDGKVPPFRVYCDRILSIRYRDGRVDGYASRLHYTSEWILQNSAAGRMREVTGEIGGKPLEQKFSFMTANSGKYPALADNPSAVAQIRRVEERLDTATEYFSIPAAGIQESLIQDGDMVCFVSNVSGLDITHVGIAARDSDGSLHFIHASLREKKVVFESKTLREYCRTSLRVVRIL